MPFAGHGRPSVLVYVSSHFFLCKLILLLYTRLYLMGARADLILSSFTVGFLMEDFVNYLDYTKKLPKKQLRDRVPC